MLLQKKYYYIIIIIIATKKTLPSKYHSSIATPGVHAKGTTIVQNKREAKHPIVPTTSMDDNIEVIDDATPMNEPVPAQHITEFFFEEIEP